ncbi:hypothetical protein CN395_25065 [Priestia megaterium]|uniref:relaxase/mobilization nuclease domain-containing protein n=1 Tax=Priestia megaterium TaxID=1404 RepID=UPI000BF96D0F|nr:relaxase/mobilization nuclease domain-containing protein [Priestia megaterium]PEU54963.1 hypothetical protein CN395_25065 [Priestia megaterium]
MALVKYSFEKRLAGGRANLKYIAFRSREQVQEKKGIFDEKENHADVGKFSKRLNDPLTRHSESAKAFKMIVSMSRDEWNKSGFQPGVSYQSIVRNVIKDYELRTGKKLDWVAAEHQKGNNPHVHILIKATYTDRDGVRHKLFLPKNDLSQLRKDFNKEIDRQRGFKIEPPNRQKRLNKQLTKKGKGLEMGIGAAFTKNLIQELQMKVKREQMEREGRRR